MMIKTTSVAILCFYSLLYIAAKFASDDFGLTSAKNLAEHDLNTIAYEDTTYVL